MPTTSGALAGIFLLMVCCAACVPSSTDSTATAPWVGTIATEGNLTTVVNESGSVWGGAATLVEEVSIGSESGADEYLFGSIAGVGADDDRIYVVDTQVPAVRVYDSSGQYLFDIGRQGQGPGEYLEPWGVATTPNGDVAVSGTASGRLNVYSRDGTPLRTHGSTSAWQVVISNMFVMSTSGVPYVFSLDHANPTPTGFPRVGMQAIGPDGATGEPLFPPSLGFEPWCLEVRHTTTPYCNVPFAPFEINALTPEVAWVVGTNDEYSFQVHHGDGRVTAITRYWTPVPVSDDEADYQRRRIEGIVRQSDPDWRWSGPDIPAHKPAYTRFLPDQSGRIWVVREGPSRRVPDDCTESFDDDAASQSDFRPCWVSANFLDAFDADGRYLGEVQVPPTAYVAREVFIRDDVFVIPAIDEAGTGMVKLYRLELPGER